MLLVESVVLAVATLLAISAPRLGARWFQVVEQRLCSLARRKYVAVAVVGLSALVLRMIVLPVEPIPEPGLQDEFSYFLSADTFSHGRITNPTHPLWVHFETFNVLQHPSYASKFPPAQGLFLAVGQVLFGHPFWGVWLSVGAMCAAICWMLQGWLPPLWALIGGLLAVLRLGTFSYWANSYWGGAVAAIGGALVLGAIARMRHRLRIAPAILLALGLTILANSRPFEGLVFVIPALALLGWFFVKNWKSGARPAVIAVGTAFLLSTIAGLSLTAYYCWRVTGSPIQMPYQLYQATYDPVPIFIWQSLRPIPSYHHVEMMSLYTGWPMQHYQLARSHPFVMSLAKVFALGFFFMGPTLTLPLIMLGIVLPRNFAFKDIRPRTRFLLLVGCLSFIGLLGSVYFSPHYAAPLTCVLYAVLIIAMQQIRRWRRTQGTGLAVVRGVMLSCVIAFLLRWSASWTHIPLIGAGPGAWYTPNLVVINRRAVEDSLNSRPGNHLVIVRYKQNHDAFQEWVYNRADIDGSRIVWAREMALPDNQRLLEYFKDRHIWLVDADENSPKVRPYSAGENSVVALSHNDSHE